MNKTWGHESLCWRSGLLDLSSLQATGWVSRWRNLLQLVLDYFSGGHLVLLAQGSSTLCLLSQVPNFFSNHMMLLYLPENSPTSPSMWISGYTVFMADGAQDTAWLTNSEMNNYYIDTCVLGFKFLLPVTRSLLSKRIKEHTETTFKSKGTWNHILIHEIFHLCYSFPFCFCSLSYSGTCQITRTRVRVSNSWFSLLQVQLRRILHTEYMISFSLKFSGSRAKTQ